jgi:7-cyano-7-deazaguanine synthase in queuosine biosynthesis
MNRKKLVICVSGGMDSYIAYFYAIKEKGYKPEDILCINFNIDQPYFLKEKEALDSFGFVIHYLKVDLISKEFSNVPDISNYIIPGRNMIFASIAGSLGERVWILGMKYENHLLMHDKNGPFFNKATVALTQAIGELTIIESPFISKTKTEIIKWALLNGITKEDLGLTVSCYHESLKRCGICSLCFKRYIAMRANNIYEEYTNNPIESLEGKMLIYNYKKAIATKDFTHYSKERIEETFKVLGVTI